MSRGAARVLWAPALAGLSLILATVGHAPWAEAYPQWQFSSQTSRCSQCHYSPAGGGIVTGYARDAVGEELSTFEGDGAFLHGALDLPTGLALQFDGRFAGLWHDNGATTGPERAFFPMQADLSGRMALGEAFSITATVGYRGQARSIDQTLGPGAPAPAAASRFISREHYVMWRPESQGPYLRVGRFFAPFGLRLAEHTFYVRRDLGFNLLEETYNLSTGWVKTDWELHVTAFGPDFLRDEGPREAGLAALYERRFLDVSTLGTQVRLAISGERQRLVTGLLGKYYLELARLLFQTELNLLHTRYTEADTWDQGFVGYLGLVYSPVRGVWLTPFVERAQTALRDGDSATNAAGLQINWFPYPHLELVLQARAQRPAGDHGLSADTVVGFLHYTL